MAAPQAGEPASYDRDTAARSALYTVLARSFENPDRDFHAAASDGALQEEASGYVAQSDLTIEVPPLRTDQSREALSATYNGLFALGHAEYTDRTDGSMETEGPPAPLYESNYREATWEDVNMDLARAYDYFGVDVDTDERDHHDNLRLELEFAAYLARRAAAGDDGADRARRDFLRRHLDPFATALSERMETVDGGFYTELATLVDRVVAADLAALREAYGGGDSDA